MEIRDYKAGDETKILELFNITFGKIMSEEYWRWRFIDNPENKIMIKLMWDNEVLAGHYAVSPHRLKAGDNTILAALSMTTMTNPVYAGRGIFTELANALYSDEFNKNQLKAVWGFPNNNSHYGFIKNLKWINLEQVPVFSIDIAQLKKTGFAKIDVVNSFDSNQIKTQEELNGSYKIRVRKSVDYLTWRYCNNPVNHYDIFEMRSAGNCFYAVTKVLKSFTAENKFEIDILELSFPGNFDLLLQLLNAIVNYYEKYDLAKINTWLPLDDPKHLIFEKIGFQPALPVTYSGIRILDTACNFLCQSKNWHYSMGDSDIY